MARAPVAWQATSWTTATPTPQRADPAPAGAAAPPARPAAFAPPPLAVLPPSPALEAAAERVTRLAGLSPTRLGEPAAHKLIALADQLPVSVPAVAYGPGDGALRRVVLGIGEEGAEGAEGPPRRLVLEVDLATLGRIRLDGLADQGRFDVLMANVPAEVRPGLRALWSMVTQRTGLAGDLDFHDPGRRGGTS
ncbi:MAG: hypothetical protein ACOC3D_06945 [Pseudomonadota bacterium]